jgi:hypothetical protein
MDVLASPSLVGRLGEVKASGEIGNPVGVRTSTSKIILFDRWLIARDKSFE